MKIINKTHWNTRDLGAIVRRVAREEYQADKFKRNRLEVKIKYGRGAGCSGYAWLNSSSSVIKVSRDSFDPVRFAFVVGHELGHCHGMKHRDMYGAYKWKYTELVQKKYGWAKDYPIGKKEVKIVTKDEKKIVKLEHAQKMVLKARTKLKRAKTILKKWESKVKRIEKTMTKAACDTGVPAVETPVQGEIK